MIGWLLVGLASAQTCDLDHFVEPESALAVAWVSPLGRRARGSIPVVRTQDLRRLGADGFGRALQAVGLRRRDRAPRRPRKVVVFDAVPADLCRPVAGQEEGQDLAGMPSCPVKWSNATRARDGCGYTVDRATGEPGAELFLARWRDLARGGFCVLPADRFFD